MERLRLLRWSFGWLAAMLQRQQLVAQRPFPRPPPIPDWVLQAIREDERTSDMSGGVVSAAVELWMARCRAAEAAGLAMMAALDAPPPRPPQPPMPPPEIPDWVLEAILEDERPSDVTGEPVTAARELLMAPCRAAEATATAMVAALDAPPPPPPPPPPYEIPRSVLPAVREDRRTSDMRGDAVNATGELLMARCSAAEDDAPPPPPSSPPLPPQLQQTRRARFLPGDDARMQDVQLVVLPRWQSHDERIIKLEFRVVTSLVSVQSHLTLGYGRNATPRDPNEQATTNLA